MWASQAEWARGWGMGVGEKEGKEVMLGGVLGPYGVPGAQIIE